MAENKFDKIFRSLEFYKSEAEKAANGNAYFAACVMLGSSLEAALKAQLFLLTGGKLEPELQQEIDKCGLFNAIKLSELCNLLTSNKRHKRSVTDLANEIREPRNLVHPNLLIEKEWQKDSEYFKRLYQKQHDSLYKIFNTLSEKL